MNINQLMKQATQMQKKLTKVQNEFNEKEFEFANGDNTISGKMKGNMTIVALNIADELLTDKEKLEDLLIVTLNEARTTIAEKKDKEIGSIAGNVSIPNMF